MFEPFRRKFSLTSNPEIGEECLPIYKYIHYFVFINSSFSPKKLSTSTYFLNTITTIPTYFFKKQFLCGHKCVYNVPLVHEFNEKTSVSERKYTLLLEKKNYASSFSSH